MARSPYPENLDRALFPHGPDFEFGHIILVSGIAGNRSDFVTGWLANSGPENFGFLPWFVEPAWGKSLILPNWNLRMIEPRRHADEHWIQRREEFKNMFDARYVPGAPVLVTKSHWTSRVWADFIPECCRGHFSFVDIMVSDHYKKDIHWQHLLKNCLNLIRQRHYRKNMPIEKILYEQLFRCYQGEFSITGDLLQDTLSFRMYLMTNPPFPNGMISSSDRDDMDVIVVDYGDLWHGAGPGSLIEKFNMPVRARAEWDLMAPLAKGPDCVWCLDRWWEPW